MTDLKVEPASFSLEGRSRYAFGDRWQFSVECEVQHCEVNPWGTLDPFGSCWLWVEGRAIGNTDASEMLTLAFSQLRSSAGFAGQRTDQRFPGMSNLDKLDFIRWVGWGEDDAFQAERWGRKNLKEARAEDVKPYWVFPPGYSPFFDDWGAILIEGETTETLVWQHQGRELYEFAEARLQPGMFVDVCSKACDWFEGYRAERMGSTLRVPEPGERPRLLHRIY
jgi:hypothetical protein